MPRRRYVKRRRYKKGRRKYRKKSYGRATKAYVHRAIKNHDKKNVEMKVYESGVLTPSAPALTMNAIAFNYPAQGDTVNTMSGAKIRIWRMRVKLHIRSSSDTTFDTMYRFYLVKGPSESYANFTAADWWDATSDTTKQLSWPYWKNIKMMPIRSKQCWLGPRKNLLTAGTTTATNVGAWTMVLTPRKESGYASRKVITWNLKFRKGLEIKAPDSHTGNSFKNQLGIVHGRTSSDGSAVGFNYVYQYWYTDA